MGDDSPIGQLVHVVLETERGKDDYGTIACIHDSLEGAMEWVKRKAPGDPWWASYDGLVRGEWVIRTREVMSAWESE